MSEARSGITLTVSHRQLAEYYRDTTDHQLLKAAQRYDKARDGRLSMRLWAAAAFAELDRRQKAQVRDHA